MNEESLKNKKNINTKEILDVATGIQNEVIKESAESKVEQKIDQSVDTIQEGSKTTETVGFSGSQSATPTSVVTPEVKTELRQAVERVMEADLKDLYLAMSPSERLEFKKKGEQTAQEITVEVQQPKININKILKLLFDWLRFIPGINRYFVEQEAKLKTDQIIKMSK